MIIVTGVGRCGTTLMIRYLRDSGLYIGRNMLYYPGIRGGFEDREAVGINQKYLNSILKKSYCNVDEEIRAYDGRVQAFKDPRILAYPPLIAVWHRNILMGVNVIWMRRDPAEVVASHRKYPVMFSPNYRCFEDMIIEHEEQFKSIMDFMKIPYTEVWFSDTLPDEFINTLKKWGYDGDKETWADLYVPG